MRPSKEIEKELEELREDAFQLKRLREFIGWQRYEKIMKGQIELLRNDTEQPLGNLLNITEREHKLGQIYGVRMALDFPEVQEHVIRSDIERLTKELRHAETIEKADRESGE